MGNVKDVVRSIDKETRDRLKERDIPDPMERICPLCLDTSGALIGSYEQTALTTTPYEDHEGNQQEDFIWKSHPNIKLTEEGQKVKEEQGWKAVTEDMVISQSSRGHSLAFYKGLEEAREAGDVRWKEDAYYYTHTDGVEALEKALRLITTEDPDNAGMPLPFTLLSGEKVHLKANKRSWENRFAERAGITWDELTARFPELYGKKTAEKKDETEEVHETDIPQDKLKEMGLEDPVEQAMESLDQLDGPDADTIKKMETETEEEKEEVMAVTAVEADLEVKSLIESGEHDEQEDDHSVVVLRLTGFDNPERMSEDTFVRAMNGEQVRYYEVELPELNYPIWVTPLESVRIGDTTYRFVEEDES